MLDERARRERDQQDDLMQVQGRLYTGSRKSPRLILLIFRRALHAPVCGRAGCCPCGGLLTPFPLRQRKPICLHPFLEHCMNAACAAAVAAIGRQRSVRRLRAGIGAGVHAFSIAVPGRPQRRRRQGTPRGCAGLERAVCMWHACFLRPLDWHRSRAVQCEVTCCTALLQPCCA